MTTRETETPDVETMMATLGYSKQARQRVREEVALSEALREAIQACASRMQAGEALSWEELRQRLTEVAEAHGYPMGIPMPDMDLAEQFISANLTPLGAVLQHNQQQLHTEMAGQAEKQGLRVRNSWTRLGDEEVVVVEEASSGQSASMRVPMAGVRLRKLLDTAMVRTKLMNLTAEAELRAMDALKEKISAQQWKSYVLNGMFPESSKRSGVFYFFRKGFPTLAASFSDRYPGGHILAALCLHPFGYYAGTFCGSMTPTDEVIAHLLLMRADEHGFWKKSGQWSATDGRSGL